MFHIDATKVEANVSQYRRANFGVKAAEMAEASAFGKMVALEGNRIIEVKLSELIAKVKPVDSDLYDIAEVFFG